MTANIYRNWKGRDIHMDIRINVAQFRAVVKRIRRNAKGFGIQYDDDTTVTVNTTHSGSAADGRQFAQELLDSINLMETEFDELCTEKS